MIRLYFPLVGSVIPESLCEGAKWSSRRQNVGSSHASEVVSPAGEGGAPGRPRQGENKHGNETSQGKQIPADEYSKQNEKCTWLVQKHVDSLTAELKHKKGEKEDITFMFALNQTSNPKTLSSSTQWLVVVEWFITQVLLLLE